MNFFLKKAATVKGRTNYIFNNFDWLLKKKVNGKQVRY